MKDALGTRNDLFACRHTKELRGAHLAGVFSGPSLLLFLHALGEVLSADRVTILSLSCVQLLLG